MVFQADNENYEISLHDLFKILIQYKKLVGLIILLSAIVTILISLNIDNKFTADALLVPSTKESVSLADKYGAVAGLAGINLSDEGTSTVENAISVMMSRTFIEKFVSKNNLKPILFKDRWNSVDETWIRQKPSMIKRIKSIFTTEDSSPTLPKGLAPNEPSIWELHEAFKKEFQINENSLDHTILISFTFTDPLVATDIVNKLIVAINENLRAEFITKARDTISYLENELKTTHISELRNILYEILGENYKKIALARAQEEYIFKVIDPAIVPEEPSSPNRILILLIGVTLGFICAVLLSIWMNFRATTNSIK